MHSLRPPGEKCTAEARQARLTSSALVLLVLAGAGVQPAQAAAAIRATETVLHDEPRIEVVGPRIPRPVLASSLFTMGQPAAARNVGSWLDILENSEPTFERNDPSPEAGRTDGCKLGNPVLLSTGNKIETEVDFESASVFGLKLVRTQNSMNSGNGIFGGRWYSTFDARALFEAPGGDGLPTIIRLMRPDGSIRSFQRQGTGPWLSAGVATQT
jgi:hypothetical protein